MVFFSVGLACLLVPFAGAPFGEVRVPSQVAERELSLVVAAPRSGPLYAPPARRGMGGIFFVGEPLIVTAALTNDSDVTVEAHEPTGWIGGLEIDLLTPRRQVLAQSIPFDLLRIRNQYGGAATTTLLRPRESLWIELRLRPGVELDARDYVVRAGVDRAVFSSDLTQIRVVVLDASTPFEIVPVTSREDRLTVLHAKGVRQRAARNFDEARETLRALLAEEPNAAMAWYELGALSIEEGSCSEGTAAFARARQMATGLNKGQGWKTLESTRAMEALMAQAGKRCNVR